MAAELDKLKEHVAELDRMVKEKIEKNKLAGDVTSHLESWHTSQALTHLTGLFAKFSGHDHPVDAVASTPVATPAPAAPAAPAPAVMDAASSAHTAEHEHHAAEHEHHAAEHEHHKAEDHHEHPAAEKPSA